MATIEIKILEQKYFLRGDDTPEHLEEVAELVKRRVEAIRKKSPSMTREKANMLAALDFASQLLKTTKKANDYRSAVVTKAKLLLDRVECELAAKPGVS